MNTASFPHLEISFWGFNPNIFLLDLKWTWQFTRITDFFYNVRELLTVVVLWDEQYFLSLALEKYFICWITESLTDAE